MVYRFSIVVTWRILFEFKCSTVHHWNTVSSLQLLHVFMWSPSSSICTTSHRVIQILARRLLHVIHVVSHLNTLFGTKLAKPSFPIHDMCATYRLRKIGQNTQIIARRTWIKAWMLGKYIIRIQSHPYNCCMYSCDLRAHLYALQVTESFRYWLRGCYMWYM